MPFKKGTLSPSDNESSGEEESSSDDEMLVVRSFLGGDCLCKGEGIIASLLHFL
jgi:hypothetical protein